MATLTMPPKIIMTSIKNRAIDVTTNLVSVTVGFNMDLDTNFINQFVDLRSALGAPIPIQVQYEYRTMTIGIKQELAPNTTYTLFIRGDNNLDDTNVTGIRSALGTAMQGDFILQFTTAKNASIGIPELIAPADKTIVETAPAFNWKPVTNAVRYEIEVSQSNLMNPIFWGSHNVTEMPVRSSLPMKDGLYYWRVRAVDAQGKVGEWSPVYLYNLDTQVESPMTPEDTLPPEIGYDPLFDDGDVEFIDSFPKQEASNLSTNLKTIYFRVFGTVSQEDVEFELYGESVLGDGVDHGSVPGTFEVLPQEDGTTIIAFTPAELQNS